MNVVQTPQGTTLQYFPVVNRKTMQLAYMLLPSYIGSPADAIRTMPGFTPFLADHRHEGLEPKCLLTGVSLEICGNYRGPNFESTPKNVQGCLGLPHRPTNVLPNTQGQDNQVPPGKMRDS